MFESDDALKVPVGVERLSLNTGTRQNRVD